MTCIDCSTYPIDTVAAFNGSSILTFTSFVIALTLYLRTIHSWAIESLEKIIQDEKNSAWPHDFSFTKNMEEHLLRVRLKIEKISGILFGYIAILISRAIYWTIHVAFPCINGGIYVRVLDAAILGAFLIGFSFMWMTHTQLARKERKIRSDMLAHHLARRTQEG